MDVHDFPWFLGKSGVHHREVPKLCAGIVKISARRAHDSIDLRTSHLVAVVQLREQRRELAAVQHIVPVPVVPRQYPRPPATSGAFSEARTLLASARCARECLFSSLLDVAEGMPARGTS